MSADPSWTINTRTVIKTAQQHFSRGLKKYNIKQKLLVTFYHSTIESILSYCITVWFSYCTEAESQRLQGVVKIAQTDHRLSCHAASVE